MEVDQRIGAHGCGGDDNEREAEDGFVSDRQIIDEAHHSVIVPCYPESMLAQAA